MRQPSVCVICNKQQEVRVLFAVKLTERERDRQEMDMTAFSEVPAEDKIFTPPKQ